VRGSLPAGVRYLEDVDDAGGWTPGEPPMVDWCHATKDDLVSRRKRLHGQTQVLVQAPRST
jgi:hypothetical protein